MPALTCCIFPIWTFPKINLYADIMQRQIKKMFVSTEIDEKRQDVRKKYRLYLVMLLYKILIEIGRFVFDKISF